MSQNPSEVGETTSSRESVKIGCVFLGPLEGWRHLLSACKKDALLLGLCLPWERLLVLGSLLSCTLHVAEDDLQLLPSDGIIGLHHHPQFCTLLEMDPLELHGCWGNTLATELYPQTVYILKIVCLWFWHKIAVLKNTDHKNNFKVVLVSEMCRWVKAPATCLTLSLIPGLTWWKERKADCLLIFRHAPWWAGATLHR